MKKKVDNKSVFALTALICILGVFLVYLFGYKKLEETATRLTAENNELKTRIESLKAYYDTEEQNKRDIETMSASLDDIYSKYAGDVRQEDGLYQGLQMSDASEIKYSSIGFGGNTSILNIASETVLAAGLENYQDAISFNRFDVTYDGVVGYAELKDLVNSLDKSGYDLAISSLSYSGTDQANLDGTAVISFYSVSGIGAEYKEPPVEPYEVGNGNLFGYTFIEKEEEEE